MEKRKYFNEAIETMPVEEIKKMQSDKRIYEVHRITSLS